MLNHTSGLPDYTKSDGFAKQLTTNPRGYVTPTEDHRLGRATTRSSFAPGSRYEYSNTDNIVVGLIAEAVTGESYGDLLQKIVFGPARLRQTSFPTEVALPRPFIHGYVVAPGEEPEDVSTFLSPSGAWASGAIVSTPRDLNAFIRADLGREFFDAAQQREQLRFVRGGESSPPGPGTNSAGLALFRYKTRCGTVYGHTGNFPGYVQFAAATADGTRRGHDVAEHPGADGRLLSSCARCRRRRSARCCADRAATTTDARGVPLLLDLAASPTRGPVEISASVSP